MKQTSSSIFSIPEYIDRTLINLKTDDAYVRFHKKVQADWNHQLDQPPIPPDRWEVHMQEYLWRVYEGFCEVLEIQGDKITPEFIRGVFQEDIRNRIKKNLDTLRNHTRLNHMPDEARKSYLGQIENSATRLHHNLLRRIEFEALELEYREGDREKNLQPDAEKANYTNTGNGKKPGRPATAQRRKAIVRKHFKTKKNLDKGISDGRLRLLLEELDDDKDVSMPTSNKFRGFKSFCEIDDAAQDDSSGHAQLLHLELVELLKRDLYK